MKFLEKSFIPNENVSLALVDARIPIELENELKNRKIEIIKTCNCESVYKSIQYHPDIALCYLGKNKIIVAPNVYDYYKNVLSVYNFDVIKGDEYLEKKYPRDIHYNVAIFGKYAIHNFTHTEPNILKYIEENKLIKINVKQGYSKCSICIVDENSIITSDEGIYIEALKYNIDCLLIQKGHISLFDMNYGFIGGATGLISSNEIAFLGNIEKHIDYIKIKEFLKKKNKKIISLGKQELIDLGSIIPLMTRKE